MTNVWLKNKAIVWALIFVFLFTSVFNTGTAYANTVPAADPAVTEETATEVIAEETSALVEHIHVWNNDAEHFVEADLTQMTEDNKLEIVVPSDYVGKDVEVEVTAADGAEFYIDEVSDSPLGNPYSFSDFDWTEENTGAVTFVVRVDEDVMEVYEITLLATGEPLEKPEEKNSGVSEEEIVNTSDENVAVIGNEAEEAISVNEIFDWYGVYPGIWSADFIYTYDVAEFADKEAFVVIPSNFAKLDVSADINVKDGYSVKTADGTYSNSIQPVFAGLVEGGESTVTFVVKYPSGREETYTLTASATGEENGLLNERLEYENSSFVERNFEYVTVYSELSANDLSCYVDLEDLEDDNKATIVVPSNYTKAPICFSFGPKMGASGSVDNSGSGYTTIYDLQEGDTRSLELVVYGNDGTQETFIITISATGEDDPEFEEFYLATAPEYSFTLEANGGAFSDGTLSKHYAEKSHTPIPLDKYEVPTREGYTFVGWVGDDGYFYEEMFVQYDITLYALWTDNSSATLNGGTLHYSYAEYANAGWGFWHGGETTAYITLPYNTNVDSLRLEVEKADRTTETVPVNVVDGRAYVTYTSTSVDGTNSITYTVDITIGEPPAKPYDMCVTYDYMDEATGQVGTCNPSFEMSNNGITYVYLGRNVVENSDVGIAGYDVDGSWFNATTKLDGKSGTCKYTSVNGKEYTIIFGVQEIFNSLSIAGCLGNWHYIQGDIFELEKNKKVVIEIPSNYAKSELYFSTGVWSEKDIVINGDNYGDGYYTYLYVEENGTTDIEIIIRSEDGTEEKYTVTISATGAKDPDFEEDFEKIATEYTFTLDANGGVFADGSGTKTHTVKALNYVKLNGFEVPTREGYVFAGWMDNYGSYVDSVSDCNNPTIIATWIEADRAEIDYGWLEYNYGENNYSNYSIWWSGTNSNKVKLPFDTKLDSVVLKVRNADRTEVSIPVVFENGKATLEYTSKSADGSNEITYTADVIIEEPPTDPYRMTASYGVLTEWGLSTYSSDITFNEDGVGSVFLDQNVVVDSEVIITGYDVDGTPINASVMLDGKAAEYTFKASNDKTYTIKFGTLDKITDLYVFTSTGSYFSIGGDLFSLLEDKAVTIVVPSNFTKSQLGLCFGVANDYTVSIDGYEPSSYAYKYFDDLEPGDTKTVEFVVSTADGTEETYKVTVSATGAPSAEFEASFEENAMEYNFTLDANGGQFENGNSVTTAEFKTLKYRIDANELEIPTREGYTFIGWKDVNGCDIKNHENNLVYVCGTELTASWMETPTEPCRMNVEYTYKYEESAYTYTTNRDFEFNADGTAIVYLDKNTVPDSEIKITGYDAGGEPINASVELDGTKGSYTFTSSNGKEYTVKFGTLKVFESLYARGCFDELEHIKGDLLALEEDKEITVEVPSNYAKADILLTLDATWRYTVIVDGEEYSSWHTYYVKLKPHEEKTVDVVIRDENGTDETYKVTIAATGEECAEFEELWERYTTEYNFTLNANGGKFADGTKTKTFTERAVDGVFLDDYEVPTREGYVFTGWVDSWGEPVDRITWDQTVKAKWMSADRPALEYAVLSYSYQGGSDDIEFWTRSMTDHVYEIPFDTDLENIKLIVHNYDRTEETVPVVFENGKATVEYVSEHLDGKNSTRFTAELIVGPAPTEPYRMILEYQAGNRWSEWTNAPRFEFNEDGVAGVCLENNAKANSEARITGYDVDETPIDITFTLDENKSGSCTFTSSNGKEYTVKAGISKVFDEVTLRNHLNSDYDVKVNRLLLEDEKEAVIEIPSNYTKARMSFYIAVQEPYTIVNPYNDFGYSDYSVSLYDMEAGSSETVEFTVRDENGTDETYKVTISATGAPDPDFEKDFDYFADDYSFTLDANGGFYADGTKTKSYVVKAVKSVSIKDYEVPVRAGYAFAGWMDEYGNYVDHVYEEDHYRHVTITAVWTPTNEARVGTAYINYNCINSEEGDSRSIWQDHETTTNILLPYNTSRNSVSVIVYNAFRQREEIPVTFDENGEATVTYTSVSYDGTVSIDYVTNITIEKPNADLNYVRVWNYNGYESVYADMSEMTEDNVLDIEIPSDYAGTRLTLDVNSKTGGVIYSEDGAQGTYLEFWFDSLEVGGTETFVFNVEAADGSEVKTYTVNVHATGTPIYGPTNTKIRECYLKYKTTASNTLWAQEVSFRLNDASEILPQNVVKESVYVEVVYPDRSKKKIPVKFNEYGYSKVKVKSVALDGKTSDNYFVEVFLNDDSMSTNPNATNPNATNPNAFATSPDGIATDPNGSATNPNGIFIPFKYVRVWEWAGAEPIYGDFLTVTEDRVLDITIPSDYPESKLTLETKASNGWSLFAENGDAIGDYYEFELTELEEGQTESVIIIAKSNKTEEEATYTINIHATGDPVYSDTETAFRECYVKYKADTSDALRTRNVTFEGKYGFRTLPVNTVMDSVYVEVEYPNRTVETFPVELEEDENGIVKGVVTITSTAKDGETTEDYILTFVIDNEEYATDPDGSATDPDATDPNGDATNPDGEESEYVELYAEFLYSGVDVPEDDDADWYTSLIEISMGAATTEDGAIVVIPYFYDRDYGIRLGAWTEGSIEFTGLGQAYEFDENGQCTATVIAKNSRGELINEYKINFVLGDKNENPENLYIDYKAGPHNQMETEYLTFDEDNCAEITVPYSYNKEYGVHLAGRDVDRSRVNVVINQTANDSIYIFNSVNEEEYTVKVNVAEPSSDTDCRFEIAIDKDDTYKGFYLNSEDFTDGEWTDIIVPYEMFDYLANDQGFIRLYAYPSSIVASCDMEYKKYEEEDYGDYRETLTPVDGKLQKVVKVTAEDGTVREYKMNFIEDTGETAELSSLTVSFPYEFWEDDVATYEYEVDLDEAATPEGATIMAPYQFNEEDWFKVYAYTDNFGAVEGVYDEDDNRVKYYLEDGKATIEITAVSPDGNNKKTYKVNIIKDRVGDSTALEELAVFGYDTEYYENAFRIEPDLSQMQDNRLTIEIPAEYAEASNIECAFNGWAVSYAPVRTSWYDAEGELWEDEGTYIYANIDLMDRNSQEIRLDVTSANGENTETYYITIVKTGSTGPGTCVEHKFDDWSTVEEATCSQPGVQLRVCTVCYHEETRAIPVKDHNLGEWKYDDVEHWQVCDGCEDCFNTEAHDYVVTVTEPTCTAEGYTTYTCECGYSYEDNYTEITDHDWGEWQIVDSGEDFIDYERICNGCGTLDFKTEIPDHEHKYTATVTEPTCTEGGYTTYTCECGDSYIADEVKATGHSYGDWTVTKEATCTDEGVETRTCACGDTETRTIAKAEHNYNAVVTAPTCTEDGYTTYTCECGDSYVADEVKATGHTYGDWIVDTEATCETAGSQHKECACGDTVTETIKALGHDKVQHEGQAATCIEDGWKAYETCSRCDYTTYEMIPATDHPNRETIKGKPATCTETGLTDTEMCLDCNLILEPQQVIKALGHDLTQHEGKEATCIEAGWEAYETCSRCDYTTYKGIAAAGHSYGEWKVTKEATCTEEGEESRTCACGDKETRTIDKIAHKYYEEEYHPTCEEKGYITATCEMCGNSYVVDETPALGHDYVVTMTDPTCYDEGYTLYECRLCGYSHKENIFEPIAHYFSEWQTIKEPTCTEMGERERFCMNCDLREYEPISETGHIGGVGATCTTDEKCMYCGEVLNSAYGHQPGPAATCTTAQTCVTCGKVLNKATGHSYKAVVTTPTCTAEGYTTYTCACGDSYVADKVAAKGHKWDAGKVTTAAKCDKAGVMTYTCLSDSKHTKTEAIAATGHSYGDWVPVKGASCEKGGTKKKTCANCGDVVKGTLPKTGHKEVKVAAVKATCSSTGMTAGTKCKNCDKVFSGLKVVEKKAHTLVTVKGIKATCTDKGLTDGKKCSVCGEITQKQTVIPAKGHRKTGYTSENIVEPELQADGTYKPGSQVKVYNCADCGIELSRETVKITKESIKVEVPELKAPVRVEVKTEVTSVPEVIKESAHEVKEELKEAALNEGAASRQEEKVDVVFMDIELKAQEDSGAWDKVEDKDFPDAGVTITLPYPAGVDNPKDFEFVIAHMITSNDRADGKKAGDIEYLTPVKTANGLQVTVKSLSPFAVVYHEHTMKDTVKPAAIGKKGTVTTACDVCGEVKSTAAIAAVKKPVMVTKVYTGKKLTQTVKIMDTKGKVITTVKLTGKNVGTYNKTVKLSGKYSGSVKVSFQINPQGTKITKLTKNGKKQFTVKWNKKNAQVTGYQIRYGTKQNLNLKGSKIVTVAKKGTTKRTIKQLKAKKKYWVQIRTYKTVNGKKYFSAWSAKKVITTK